MLQSQFALRKIIRLGSSVSRCGLGDADARAWSEWSLSLDDQLEALAEAGNELHGAGTHWVERDIRFPGQAESDTMPRMFEIRVAYRFTEDAEGFVRGSTPWTPDTHENLHSLEMFLTGACASFPDVLHWLERRVA